MTQWTLRCHTVAWSVHVCCSHVSMHKKLNTACLKNCCWSRSSKCGWEGAVLLSTASIDSLLWPCWSYCNTNKTVEPLCTMPNNVHTNQLRSVGFAQAHPNYKSTNTMPLQRYNQRLFIVLGYVLWIMSGYTCVFWLVLRSCTILTNM